MRRKYKTLAKKLQNAALGGRCALWFSGGKDSLLLLEIMLKLNLKFALLTFAYHFNKEQKKRLAGLMDKANLLLYSYPPNRMTLIGDGGENISLVQIFAVDGQDSVSLVSDLADGARCAFDLCLPLGANVPVRFDTHIWGTKKADVHWAGLELKEEKWKVGKTDFIAPLFDFSDAEVLEALDSFGADYTAPPEQADAGNAVVCHNCLKQCETAFCPKENKYIPAVKWNPRENWERWKNA